MPILLVFLLTAACLPIEWPAPPFGLGRESSAALTAAAVFLPLTAAAALRGWVLRSLGRDPGRRIDVAQTYTWVRRGLFFVNVGAVGLSVLGLGWGWAVQQTLVAVQDGKPVLLPFAEFAVPLPY